MSKESENQYDQNKISEKRYLSFIQQMDDNFPRYAFDVWDDFFYNYTEEEKALFLRNLWLKHGYLVLVTELEDGERELTIIRQDSKIINPPSNLSLN